MTELPEWHECYEKKAFERNPLEEFVYCNEPADIEQCKEFREGLKRLIEFVTE